MTLAEIAALLARAAALDALPVPTAKDAVRLGGEDRARIRVVPVRAVWRDPAALTPLLDRLLPPGGPHGESA